MAKPANNTAPSTEAPATVADALTRDSKASKPAKEKQKAVGFRNWQIVDPKTGEIKHRSSRGDSLFDNEFLSREDKKFLAMAEERGGEVVIANVQFVIRLNKGQSELSDDLFDVVEKED